MYKEKKSRFRIILTAFSAGIIAILLSVSGCGQADSGSVEAGRTLEKGQKKLRIAAAASLKNIYENELIPRFEGEYPGVVLEGIYDSSGKLQIQIEEGMEVDIFMSAASKQMESLEESGLVEEETRMDILENKIVMIVPKGNKAGLKGFQDIGKAGIIVLGDPESVPAGQYAKESLTSLGLWDMIQDRVSFGTNVTEVLYQVAEASADAGIVYATDAAALADRVEIVEEAPQGSLSERVIYPIAIMKNTAYMEEAEHFLEFLSSEEAGEIWTAYGFSPINLYGHS
ncbi:molybdate ABC transporter substrate-binding protein [Lachnospiraceae bacterium 62-35]